MWSRKQTRLVVREPPCFSFSGAWPCLYGHFLGGGVDHTVNDTERQIINVEHLAVLEGVQQWVRVHKARVRVRVHQVRVQVHQVWVRVHWTRVQVRVHWTRVRVQWVMVKVWVQQKSEWVWTGRTHESNSRKVLYFNPTFVNFCWALHWSLVVNLNFPLV